MQVGGGWRLLVHRVATSSHSPVIFVGDPDLGIDSSKYNPSCSERKRMASSLVDVLLQQQGPSLYCPSVNISSRVCLFCQVGGMPP